MLGLSRIVSKNPQAQLVESEVDREIVMLRLDTGICYGLNKVGTAIWREISSPVTIGDICAALLARYDVDPETCENQVMDLLNDMRAEGFISVSER